MTELEILEKRLADLPAGPERTRERVDLLNAICHLHRDLEHWDEVYSVTGQALRLADEVGYLAGRSESLSHQAFADYMRTDFNAAISKSLEALRLATDCGAIAPQGFA